VTYPRIVTCRVTGVKMIVESVEEELAFHRAILPMMAICLGLLICALAALGLLIWMLAP
jgi:hypothetical protein